MRPVRECLNPQLARLCEKTHELERLQQQIRQVLSESFWPHTAVASYHQGKLLLTVSNAHWLSLLRFQLPQLRDALRRHGLHELSNINLTIKQDIAAPQQTIKQDQRHLSQKSAALINNIAQHIDYPPLKAALQNMAKQAAEEGLLRLSPANNISDGNDR